MTVFSKIRDLLGKIDGDDAAYVAWYIARYHSANWEAANQVIDAVRWIRAAMNRPDDSAADLVHAMKTTPRCGCADPLFGNEVEAVQAKWNKPEVTYHLAAYVSGLSKDQQEANALLCAKQTMAVCGLKIRRAVSGDRPDLTLTTKQLDGPGRVLGENYLPMGDNRPILGWLDSGERWNEALHSRVVRHETFGHGMGVSHITTPNSVMNPYLQSLDDWQQGDIAELVKRYGKPVAAPAPVPPVGDDSRFFVDIRKAFPEFDIKPKG